MIRLIEDIALLLCHTINIHGYFCMSADKGARTVLNINKK